MTDNPLVRIRQMRKKDIEEAICLSMAEGWNQTEKDWKLLLEGPDNVCLAAEYENTLAGTATALCHSGKIAWIGMVLVDKRLRGQGIGRKLLLDIIKKLRNVESIKLDATPAGLPLYEHIGFIEEYKIIRMICPGSGDFYYQYPDGVPLHTEPEILPEILKLDTTVFGVDRTYLLNSIYKNYPLKAFHVRQNYNLNGYIFGRDGSRFHYLGPVSAVSVETARALIAKAMEILNHQPIAIDVLEDKEALISWLESIGYVRQRNFVRMYLKGNFPGKIENQYLISGPEFG